MPVQLSRENNFDIIRLMAAVQVMFFHCYEHLHFSSPVLNGFIYALRFFSGVPVFFTVSGFLIFASFDRSPELTNYFRNRFLRIYPGLWVCLLFTIILLFAFGYITTGNIASTPFIAWTGTQASFLQFYTPAMLRGFGVGSPNGSLWTIPVEISFYLFVPVIFWLFRKVKISRNIWLALFMVLSIIYNVYYQQYKFRAERSDFIKLMGINLGPYLFYFLLGAMAYVNWGKISRWYQGKGWIWLCAYLLYCIIFSVWLRKFELTYWTSIYHFIAIILLSQAVIALAFSHTNISAPLLHGNDISYGVYLYHMPVINALLVCGCGGNNYSFVIVTLVTVILAYLSWKLVERPALRHKRKTIHQLVNSSADL